MVVLSASIAITKGSGAFIPSISMIHSSLKVSIVTISYNQAPFLREAMESVLGQDYSNIEYLVLDGGSTDGSRAVIEEFAPRLAYWVSEPDGGAAAALNRGFARATGEIFAYLNSDDLLLPGAVSAWVRAFEERPSLDVVYGDMDIVDAAGRPATLPGRRVSRFKAIPCSPRSMAAGANVIPQQASAWRRTIHEKVGGFCEENKTCWDWEFFIDAAIRGASFQHIPRVLAKFRVHDASISGTNKHQEARIRDHARIREKWLAAGYRLTRGEVFARRLLGRMRRSVRYLLKA
jgi:GT2 family glycosyltransferase